MMGEIAPALLLAIAGYVTLRHCANRTRFRWAALDWDQNVFESAAVGAILFAIIRVAWFLPPPSPLVEKLVRPSWPLIRSVAAGIHAALPFRYSASLVGTFLLGIVGGYLSNTWWGAEGEVRRAVRDYGGDLRIILHAAAKAGWPVSLTMKNRKVYVGLIFVPPGLEEPGYVNLSPTLSGYRNESLGVIFTTRYDNVYEDLKKIASSGAAALGRQDFGIVLPMANIESANRYDNDVYMKYFAAGPTVTLKPQPAKPNSAPNATDPLEPDLPKPPTSSQ